MMDEIEVTEIPPLTRGEQTLLDMHSVINVLNVLRCELMLLGTNAAGDEGRLSNGLALCERMLDALAQPERALHEASRIERYEQIVFDEIAASRPPAHARREEADSLGNLRSVFAILKVRAREILARAAAPGRWEPIELGALRAEFVAFFEAVATNSRGRFGVRTNAALQEPADYYIDLKFESATGSQTTMPGEFRDVMRDLIANARKYTKPGGHITAALHDDAQALRFVVVDNGRGIPKDELATVVHYGKRASNVSDVRTLGGGFGLTKAFLVTKQFGGSFRIASALGVGTRIRITIPRPR